MFEPYEDPRYVDVPLAVFSRLADRLTTLHTTPPFAAVEVTVDGCRYGALLTGTLVRVVVCPQQGPDVSVRDVLSARPVAIAHLSRPQRDVLYGALSAWYVGRLVNAGLLDRPDA